MARRSAWTAYAACAFAWSASAVPPPEGLTVKVIGLRSNQGKVACALYASAKGYPVDPTAAIKKLFCPIVQNVAVCPFGALPAGTYAVSCFHDENGNDKLDTNFIGIPKEGVVASNHAKGSMGPPKFEDARFTFSGAQEMVLRISY